MVKTAAFDLHCAAYEAWFERNPALYQAELEALRRLMPRQPWDSLEVGVGSGLFAAPLNVRFGLEPSSGMAKRARRRGVGVVSGVAEALPFLDARFDLVLFVATLCFVDDAPRSLREAWRVLRPGGCLLIGFIDAEGELGRRYAGRRNTSLFYRDAVFFPVGDLSRALQEAGFKIGGFVQALLSGEDAQLVLEGWGRGSFVAVQAFKA